MGSALTAVTSRIGRLAEPRGQNAWPDRLRLQFWGSYAAVNGLGVRLQKLAVPGEALRLVRLSRERRQEGVRRESRLPHGSGYFYAQRYLDEADTPAQRVQQ
jgi:hypothetical protein